MLFTVACGATAAPGSGDEDGTGGTSDGAGGSHAGRGGSRGSAGGSAGHASGGDDGAGGARATGGASGMGGVQASGGAPGTGGMQGAGGAGGSITATGGSVAGTGGSPGAGGAGASVYDCAWGAPRFAKLAPSTAPPGGLALANVPQFIAIGFDDNAYEDGMKWILDFMKSKTNPRGSGNHCTFDGTPARVSFFINSHVGITSDALKALHARAYQEGHEAANHTDTHADTLQQNPDKAVWTKELTTCNDYLVGLGVPRAAILGFRTPFLQQSEATFQVIVEQKFRYDSSIEHYYGTGGFDWPYSLEAGKDLSHTYQGFPRESYAALWEMPVHELMLATTGYTAVTGLDYNMWIAKKMQKQQFVDVLKANLQIRMKGGNEPANRAPLLFGGHTDLYAQANGEANATAVATVGERRAAVEEFITWALAYDPAVRVVPYAEVLHWMQSPVGLDGTRPK
jgi:hypothetical protein